MSLSDVSIKRPVFTTMMSTVLIVLGLLGLSRLGTDLYPEVTMPFVMVTTVWPGAGPEDVEAEVTDPIEDALAGISGVERLFSQSRENVSFVFIQFELSVPNAEATQDVRDKVATAVRDLPADCEAPVVAPFDLASQPVVVFSASAGDDPAALRDLVVDQVKPRLEQLDGVAAVRVLGGAEREVQVDLDPDRLASAGVGPQDIIQRLKAEHVDLPGGKLPAGQFEAGVRVRGRFKDVEALRDMVVSTGRDGSHVRLRDVALVLEAVADPETLVRTNGEASVGIEVVKRGGTNTVEVAHEAKRVLAELEKEVGVRTQVLIDQSVQVEANAHEVWIAIGFGGVMAVLIILLFLLDVRGTIISALALPTSVVGTFFLMWALDYSLNQLTLLGLSLAIGLLIDDAVVVRESITRRLEMGQDPVTAASEGTKEIALAVLATTLTLCAVFVPVAFMQGIIGRFFRQFGLTISGAVLISLFVAFTLDPMLSARFAKATGHDSQTGGLTGAIRRAYDRLDAAYGRSLDAVLRWPKLTASAAALVFFGSLGVAANLGTDFLGAEDRGQLTAHIDFPPGTRLLESAQRSAVAEEEVRKLPGVTAVYAVIGPRGDSASADWRINVVDKRERAEDIEWFKQRIREILGRIPDAQAQVGNPPALEGLGDWPPLFMQIVGPDLAVLRKEAAHLEAVMKSTPGIVDVKVVDRPGKPETVVDVRRDDAARLGLPAGLVAMQVRLMTEGEVAGTIRDGRLEREIRVRLAAADRDSSADLGRLELRSALGAVRLYQVATLSPSEGPSVVEHESRARQIAVTGQMGPGASLGKVVTALRASLGDHKLPEGYSLIWNGQQKDMAEMQGSIALALGLAIVFIYMVLASQFESFIHPLTIMLSLPLALIGAVLGLAVTGNTLGMGANIGVILLMGLVTKNAILLVDGALVRMREGDSPAAALRDAGPRRLRPILMTSAAMVLGMLPTALGRGMGSEFRSPMAISVIGGVITSTLLTLWVVPVVFLAVERVRRWFRPAEA